MTQLWKDPADYPDEWIAIYDKELNERSRFDFMHSNYVNLDAPLRFHFEKPIVCPDLNFLPSTSGSPLANEEACRLLQKIAKEDIQFIPCAIDNGGVIINHYFLLNFLHTTDAIDRDKSIPQTTNVAGEDIIFGYRKLVLIENLPITQVARQVDYTPYIVVRDDFAEKISSSGMTGIRFLSGVIYL